MRPEMFGANNTKRGAAQRHLRAQLTGQTGALRPQQAKAKGPPKRANRPDGAQAEGQACPVALTVVVNLEGGPGMGKAAGSVAVAHNVLYPRPRPYY